MFKLPALLDTVIIFGRYHGRTLKEVIGSPEGIRYARWAADNARSARWRTLFKAALREARL